MLIPLDFLVNKYNIQFRGILHVGAHECEELSVYDNYLTRNNMLWIEALPDKVEFCKKMFPNILIEQAVVSDSIEIVTFNRANNDQSSSFLEFGLHSVFHSDIKFVDSFQTETKMLKDIICNYNIPFNFVNLDIQGVELKALKGMGDDYLNQIQYIYTEVNSDYVYKNCAIIGEIDDYLKKFGFERVETSWCGDCRWGDAFYLKK